MADNEIGKELEESTESPAEKVARREQELHIAKQQLETIKGQNASLVEQAKLAEQIADIEHKKLEAIQAQARQAEQVLASELEALKARKKAGEDLDEEIEKAQKLLDAKKAKNDQDQRGLDIAERQAAIDKKRDKFAEGFIKRWTGLEEGPGDSLIGNMIFDAKGTIGSLGKEFVKLANPLNLTKNITLKAVQATMALAYKQDQAVVNFRRATGASGEFDANIMDLERSLYTAGVNAAEAGQAVQTLFLNVTDFTKMSDEQTKTLGETVAVLNELGVSAETTTKNMQFAIKVLGKSTDQAEHLTRELFTFAQDLGVSGDKMASDFAAMGPQIAALGSKGVDAFRKLEVQAKNTGLQLTEILGVVEKFDKFDSAAESVGKLNALLGGPYLNTLELVAETDPSKRFEILKTRIDQAGLSFDDMDYYQRKAMASAVGLNEQQLALMMRGNLDLIKEPVKSAKDLEALAIQTAQFNTVTEELSQIAKGLLISIGPLIGGFKGFLQLLSPVTENLDVLVYTFGTFGIGAALARLATINLGMAFASLLLKIQALNIAQMQNILIGGLAIFLPLIAAAGPAFRVVAIGIGMIVAAMIALGVAEKTTVIFGVIGLIVAGIAALAHSIAVGNSPSLVQAFMMVAAAIPLMGLALLGLMPLLPALLLLIPPLALGFAMIASTLSDLLSDQFVTNLQLMAVEIANIVDKINELNALKAAAFAATTAVVATSTVATGVTSAALSAVGLSAAAGGGGAPAAAPAATGGGAPTIHVHLSIDGTEFATAVNKVEVEKYSGGTPKGSSMYNTIVDMIEQGFVKGQGTT